MRKGRILARLLRRKAIVWFVTLSSFSGSGIELIKVFLLLADIRFIRLWPQVLKYIRFLIPEHGPLRSLIRYHWMRVDQAVWSTLVYNAWDHAIKYNDFSDADELREITGRGKGLLLLSMHYGPMFGGYVLYRMGLQPAILAARFNIPYLDSIPGKSLLTNEYIFRGAYDGIVTAGLSEKRFIRLMSAGRPGLIMIDGLAEKNFLLTNCLGVDYPIGIFPFKLALTHSFPVAIIWFSKIRGKGYRLNVREICFSTIEEGVKQYGALLDQIVRTDPFLWCVAKPFYRAIDRCRN